MASPRLPQGELEGYVLQWGWRQSLAEAQEAELLGARQLVLLLDIDQVGASASHKRNRFPRANSILS